LAKNSSQFHPIGGRPISISGGGADFLLSGNTLSAGGATYNLALSASNGTTEVLTIGLLDAGRGAVMHEPFPKQFAGGQDRAENLPLVFRGGCLRAFAAAIEPFLRQLRLVGANHRRKQHAVAPCDR
jgi:hypothetical protein